MTRDAQFGRSMTSIRSSLSGGVRCETYRVYAGHRRRRGANSVLPWSLQVSNLAVIAQPCVEPNAVSQRSASALPAAGIAYFSARHGAQNSESQAFRTGECSPMSNDRRSCLGLRWLAAESPLKTGLRRGKVVCYFNGWRSNMLHATLAMSRFSASRAAPERRATHSRRAAGAARAAASRTTSAGVRSAHAARFLSRRSGL
jgi:hypothetical protein